MTKSSIHLKGLNGIRCIAAVLVIISHTFLNSEGFFGLQKMKGIQFAGYGVTMFFTLSGFLITYLLLKEKQSFGTISIKQFYIRRLLRIWPLYYFNLAIALVVIYFSYKNVLPGSLPYYLLMGANIPFALGNMLPLIGHYWSLGVEEQFYLFWPWLVKIFSPLKSISLFLAGFLLIKLCLRLFIPQSVWYQLICITKFDCMAIGALAAIIFKKNIKGFSQAVMHPVTQIFSWLLYVLIAAEILPVPDFFNNDVFSIACALIILNVAFNPRPLIGLENRLFDFLGKISYGLYIYHSLVLYFLGKCLKGNLNSLPNTLQITVVVTLVLLVSIVISWISYEFFEKRFLHYKERFAKVSSTA